MSEQEVDATQVVTEVEAAAAAEPQEAKGGADGETKGESKDSGNFWVTQADALFPIQIGAEGAAAEEAKTVCTVFKETVDKFGESLALIDLNKNEITWQGYYNKCSQFAKSLISLGVQPHESVNMIGFNAPEYLISDVGAIMAGCIAAGIYTTNEAEACHYVAEHSEAVVVVCQGRKQLNKFLAIADRLPKLKALVMYNLLEEDTLPEDWANDSVALYMFDDFMALGAEVGDDQLTARIDGQQPGHCCSLIYTSGTTGNPKAVMISHDNITWTARRLTGDLQITSAERMISYLPLNHIAAQILDIHAPMANGYQITFARPDALKGSLRDTLVATQPTIFFGVPRVWEKFREAMLRAGAGNKGCKLAIAKWAKRKGGEYGKNLQFGASGNAPCCFGCANSIVFTKVKKALGLDKCRLAYTGAAPITQEVLDYFASLNIQVYELFGQSECTGPATYNFPGGWKTGTCGRPLEGTELIIAEDTKEIVYRGRHIFMGYLKNPEKTAEAIDGEGYLHSGDQGKVDSDGFMSIIGRIKELIITAGGENIPPVLIEEQILKALPAVSNACVIGDQKKYLTVLITLKSDVDADTNEPKDTLAGDALAKAIELGLAPEEEGGAITVAMAAASEEFKQYITDGLTVANENATSRAQTVKKFRILPADFSIPGGELTATLKTKRPVVHEKYAEVIEEMYGEAR